jgi:hypothetical protein
MKSFIEIEKKDIELYNRKVEYIRNFVILKILFNE